MIIENITNCSRCGGNHGSITMHKLSGDKNPHYTHFAMCPSLDPEEPILINIVGEEVTIYRKCSKCGRSAEIKTNDPTKPTLCTFPMGLRTSGICGGSFTEEYTKEEYEKDKKNYECFPTEE